MTRRKRFLLALLVLVLVSQAPFAYRRYRLGRLNSAIQTVNSQRAPQTSAPDLVEYKGVMHVHSFLGGHSRGTFEEIVAGAKSNQLSFVVMTEHTSDNFNTAAMTLKGMHAGVLFINGNEVSTAGSGRLLVVPGDESADSATGVSTQEAILKAKARGALSFVAYPEDFKSWDASFDGIEIYNVYTNARQINPLVMFFDGLWSYHSYPDLLFANFYSRPTANLQRWDEITTTGRRVTAIAGNDAHANIGIKLEDSSGKTLLGMRLDPYERSFRLVRIHVLIPAEQPLTSETLLAALGMGHCFIGFDLFGDTTGFSFSASNGSDISIQGDELPLDKEVRLTVSSPVAGRVVLFRDGRPIHDEAGIQRKDFVVTEKGSYRTEVYLPQLPKPVSDQPWIISNPIYLR
jgi:hypothetical protein